MNLRPIHRLLTIAATFCAPILAYAQTTQEATGLGHPQFFVTPYLWLAGVYATTQTPLERVPTVNSSVGPFEMLGHLEQVTETAHRRLVRHRLAAEIRRPQNAAWPANRKAPLPPPGPTS